MTDIPLIRNNLNHENHVNKQQSNDNIDVNLAYRILNSRLVQNNIKYYIKSNRKQKIFILVFNLKYLSVYKALGDFQRIKYKWKN